MFLPATFLADVADYLYNSEANWMVGGRINSDKSRDAMRRNSPIPVYAITTTPGSSKNGTL